MVEAFCLGDEWPDWWADAVSAGNAKTFNLDGRLYGGPDCAEITTAHGVVRIERGDWVIQGPGFMEGSQGTVREIFACKSDVFAAMYERVP